MSQIPVRTIPVVLVVLAFTGRFVAQVGQSAGDIYKKASPAVVLIELTDEKGQVTGAGSGFLVSADGKILTNYHVVAHSKQATVRLANKDAYDTVTVLDIDKRKDIALLKIQAVDLPYLPPGRSANVEVGDAVFALTNPLGVFQNTLSQGIVGGIRQGDGFRWFQITAPISHGSSGGPIFNSKGEVIGIAVATLEEGQNLNFAVPIDYARGMLASPNPPKPLSAIYEPEPTPPAPASATEAANKPATSAAALPDELKGQNSLGYVEKKLRLWTKEDASKVFGEPRRHREGAPGYPADIYAYADPTGGFRELELGFSRPDGKLHDIYAYPWNMTWDQCKQLWGTNASTKHNPDGTVFHVYRDRHLNVYVNKHGDVISVGIY